MTLGSLEGLTGAGMEVEPRPSPLTFDLSLSGAVLCRWFGVVVMQMSTFFFLVTQNNDLKCSAAEVSVWRKGLILILCLSCRDLVLNISCKHKAIFPSLIYRTELIAN